VSKDEVVMVEITAEPLDNQPAEAIEVGSSSKLARTRRFA
jgi:hypothetical protein